MDINHICINCMSDKGTAEVCPVCGFTEGEQQDSPMFLPPRTILNGRYLLGRVLGYGGFGITYLAYDLNLQIKLAIKEYLPQSLATRTPGQTTVSVYTGDAQSNFAYGLEKFIDEARMLAQFNSHPCIVSVQDFFKENGTAYLVMEYIEGINFKEYLDQQGGKVSWQTALEVMTPVLDALLEVHSTGLLHRDISPDNIYITAKKQVKLLDFGAARYAMGEHSKTVILKPGYAPIEQYFSKGIQGSWTDIYAAGATIYRAITGMTPPEALDRMKDDDLQLPSRLGVALPGQAEKALLKALAVDGDKRFQTVGEFQDALGGKPVPLPPVPPRPKPVPNRKSILVFSGIAVAAVACLFILLFVMVKPDPTGQQRLHETISDSTSAEVSEPPEGISISSLSLDMAGVPGAAEFPTGKGDSDRCTKVNYPYYMGKTEVTYEQWKQVYNWAVEHGYIFYSSGSQGGYDRHSYKVYNIGHTDHPVTEVSWRDAVVWLNALTEYSNAIEGTNYSCVYLYNGNIVRDSTNATICDNVKVDTSAGGFRLPTSMEWELAARYVDGKHWTLWNYASGAIGPFTDENQTSVVAWYSKNSNDSTHPVGIKAPNALGIYDMSGNVDEWCFDWYPGSFGLMRVKRGGSWFNDRLCVGLVDGNIQDGGCYGRLGFRLVRNI